MSKRTIQTFIIIFRVIGRDVYEIPVEATNRYTATKRAIAFIGYKRNQVVVCDMGE